MTARPTLIRAPDASNDSRLTEAEVDSAIAERVNDWRNQQGRYGDVPMPEVEVPSLKSPRSRLWAAVVIVATIAGSALIDGYTAAEVLHLVGL